MAAAKIKVRPLTIALVVLAAVFVAGGIYYFVTPAHDLAAFVPGHESHGTNHHIKHGIAMIGVAVVLLIAAWFTTSPQESAST